MIAIIDYGMGNIRSLSNAFEYIGEDVVITSDLDEINAADRIVLPGVGAFGDAVDAIRSKNLDRVLTHQAMVIKKPMIGICLGMQLFAKSSTEHGSHRGLGWLDAKVERLTVEPPLKIPHVGWNSINYEHYEWLFQGLPKKEANFYFVHSYHMQCHDPKDVIATVDYGVQPVTAIAGRDNLLAIQFHPEKSQDNGLCVLENWLKKEF